MTAEGEHAAERASLHSGPQVRPFQCRLCGRSFVKNEHLVRHVRSHTKEKPFRCPDCGNRYSRQDILIRHQRDVRCKRPRTEPEAPTEDHPAPGTTIHSEGDATTQMPDTTDPLSLLSAAASQRAEQARENGSPTHIANASAGLHGPGLDGMIFPPPGAPDVPEVINSLNNPTELVLPDQNDSSSSYHAHPVVEFEDSASNLLDFSECFPSWTINPAELMEMDISPFDQIWTPEPQLPPSSLDLKLVQVQLVQRMWFTYVPEHSTDELYPEPGFEPNSMPVTAPGSPRLGANEIDDRYRRSLKSRLHISSYEPSIPSADLLNVWVRLYFAKVHPVFPIIHAPTFRPSRANANLLIAICATGSLFTGSAAGLRQGIHLFERIHKATLVKWEKMVATGQDTMIPIIQSAILCQMFGMLSGSPALLRTVDAFHGPPIAWARHASLLQPRPPIQIEPDATGQRLEELWREWARNEEVNRIAHGLYILDSELASVLHRDPLQSFNSYKFSYTSSNAAFTAPNARDWHAKMLASKQHGLNNASSLDSYYVPPGCLDPCNIPAPSVLTSYTVLEGIGMHIRSCRTATSGLDEIAWKAIQQPLTVFYRQIQSRRTSGHHDPLHLSILWHCVHLMAFADIDLLEKAVGRDGCRLLPAEYEAVTSWAESDAAQKCAVHAGHILQEVQSTSIAYEVAMHVPRALFWAAVVVFCRIRYSNLFPQHRQFSGAANGLADSGLAVHFTGSGPAPSRPETRASMGGDCSSLKTMLFALTDVLQHVGHWEIARKFAGILTALSNFAFDLDQGYA